MRQIGSRLKYELDEIQDKLATLAVLKAETEAAMDGLKARVLEISQQYDFPDSTEKSKTYGALQVVRPEGKLYVDFQKFIEVFGFEIFLQCFDITAAELSREKWDKLVREEIVLESALRPLVDQKNSPKPSVRLIKGKLKD